MSTCLTGHHVVSGLLLPPLCKRQPSVSDRRCLAGRERTIPCQVSLQMVNHRKGRIAQDTQPGAVGQDIRGKPGPGPAAEPRPPHRGPGNTPAAAQRMGCLRPALSAAWWGISSCVERRWQVGVGSSGPQKGRRTFSGSQTRQSTQHPPVRPGSCTG